MLQKRTRPELVQRNADFTRSAAHLLSELRNANWFQARKIQKTIKRMWREERHREKAGADYALNRSVELIDNYVVHLEKAQSKFYRKNRTEEQINRGLERHADDIRKFVVESPYLHRAQQGLALAALERARTEPDFKMSKKLLSTRGWSLNQLKEMQLRAQRVANDFEARRREEHRRAAERMRYVDSRGRVLHPAVIASRAAAREKELGQTIDGVRVGHRLMFSDRVDGLEFQRRDHGWVPRGASLNDAPGLIGRAALRKREALALMRLAANPNHPKRNALAAEITRTDGIAMTGDAATKAITSMLDAPKRNRTPSRSLGRLEPTPHGLVRR